MNNKRLAGIICFVICILLSISCVNAGIFEFAEDTGDDIADDSDKIDNEVEQNDAESDNDVVQDSEKSEDITIFDYMNLTPFSKDTTVTIGGIDFNIPKGFAENVYVAEDETDKSVKGSDSISTSYHFYINEDESIFIGVLEGDSPANLDDFSLSPGEVKKTIAGEKGLFSEKEDYCEFTYCKDSKVVMIGADTEDLISEVIIN